MYSKRQLYKPAPKQNVGQKKVRKLVQGTLVSTNLINPIPEQQSQRSHHQQTDNDNVNDSDSNENNSRQNVHGFTITRPVSSDVLDDPSMSPRRFVPALTEYASPLAEPPSRCLDLSDTELNLSMASSTSTATRQQPIMVCDASHLGSSPDNTEVEVLVEYEDSPARVICHTPGRSEKFRASESNRSSPRSTTASTGRRGPISLKFDSPKAGVSISGSSGGDNNNQNLKEQPTEKGGSRSLLISEASRGIIKEILAEEIGSRDCSSLSLYSHGSPPSSRGLPRSSSPAEASKQYPSPVSKNFLQSGDDACLNKTPPKSKEIPNPFVTDMFGRESDSLASDENTNTTVGRGRIDRTPKIEAAKKMELLKHQNDSDSETCSLYEYVTQKNKDTTSKETPRGKEIKSNKPQSQDIVKKPRSAKKKTGRVVASRFMQGASTTNLKSNSSLNSTKGSINTSSRSDITKPKIMTAKASLKPSARMNRLLDATKSTPPVATSANSKNNTDADKNKKERLTSTPTQDDSCYPYEIDASSILPSYTMALSDKDGSDSDHALQRNTGIVKKSKTSRDKVTSLQQDIQYARYIQVSYLFGQTKKSFKGQEKQAMEQLHGLWKLHEKKRVELCQSKTELQRLKTRLQIDTALDKTQSQLNSLEEKLPQVGDYYSNLCSALNNTRHQIATKDIHIPNKTEEDRENYEDRLESTLRESENLLKEITSKAGHVFPSLHQYVASIEAIKGNVEESGNELRQSYTDLDVAHGLCSQLSSRMVMPEL